ncbi:hypothetical protein GCM10023205_71360 [Yinghuangia aomiensis]|uniref:Phasin protein n=1 Tax=Yinghuangia aomiensis TaxID=676205 RepID=A0ABP9I6D6_9ACTN
MSEDNHIDRALSPWLYEGNDPPSAEPAETRLLSAAAPSGAVQLTPEALLSAATRLEGLRGETNADVNVALKDSDHAAIGRNLQLTQAVDHVHERWGEKLKHLLEDMDDRAGRIRKAATNWHETEQAITKALSKK